MVLKFFKYQGTGNDFIILDNRKSVFPRADAGLTSFLCDRKFGIGSDGLMLLESRDGFDFEMVYFNSDGKTSSMCGNGGRCIVSFAKRCGIVKSNYLFLAADGQHEAVILSSDEAKGKDLICLKMNDVGRIESNSDHYVLDTGSPHYVQFAPDIAGIDVKEEGRKIRNSARFFKEGINVNFVEFKGGKIFIRTYERGVENETLSCGTGMTAAAVCSSLKGLPGTENHIHVVSNGGETIVRFRKSGNGSFQDIWLEGPAQYVFEGEIEV